jgi:hypothetical protein
MTSGCCVGEAAAHILRQLRLQAGELRAGGAAEAGLAARDRRGRRGGLELVLHGGDRAAGGDDGLVELRELGAGDAHAVADGAGAGHDADIALLELHAALLGLLELNLALAQFLVEEGQRLGGLLGGSAAADEQVDQLLHHGGGGAGVLGVAEAAEIGGGGDLEQIVGQRRDLDLLAQRRDRAAERGVVGDERVQLGAAHHARQILVGRQRLLQPQQIALLVLRHSGGRFARQHLLHLREQLGLAS